MQTKIDIFSLSLSLSLRGANPWVLWKEQLDTVGIVVKKMQGENALDIVTSQKRKWRPNTER